MIGEFAFTRRVNGVDQLGSDNTLFAPGIKTETGAMKRLNASIRPNGEYALYRTGHGGNWRFIRIVHKGARKNPRRVVAWTGGSSWKSGTSRGREFPLTPAEKAIARSLYAEQVKAFSSYWKRPPDKDTRDIFRGRANADAYATVRAGETATNPKRRKPPHYVNKQLLALHARAIKMSKKKPALKSVDCIELRGVKSGKVYLRLATTNTNMADLKAAAKAISARHGEAVSAHRKNFAPKPARIKI